MDRTIGEDSGLQRLKGIPGAVVLTSRQATFGDEFEPYRIGFLGMEQCKEIYEKIRFPIILNIADIPERPAFILRMLFQIFLEQLPAYVRLPDPAHAAKTVSKVSKSEIHGSYVGRDSINGTGNSK
mgnify:CR=1 FL=1